MSTIQVKKALKPNWQRISYIARGNKSGKLQVHLRKVATATLHSVTSLRTGEAVLLPVQLAMCSLRISAEDIIPEVDITWFAAAILLGLQLKVVVPQATRTPHWNWQGKNLSVVVHSATEDIEYMLETITVGQVTLRIEVEGRITRWHNYSLKSTLERASTREGYREA